MSAVPVTFVAASTIPPVPAVIDRTFVEPGEYVQAGQRILMLHNAGEVWIEANIEETQDGTFDT